MEKIILITQYYKCKTKERQKELESCLQINIHNKYISKIILLSEKELPSYLCHEKVKVIDRKSRSTFGDMFKASNDYKGEICIIANSDIYFDDSLKFVYKLDLTSAFLTPCRYNVREDGSYYKPKRRGGGVDAWFFKSPTGLENINIMVGALACDQRLNHVIWKRGYELYNCYEELKIYHLHLVDEHNYLPKVDGRKMMSSKIDTNVKKIFKNSDYIVNKRTKNLILSAVTAYLSDKEKIVETDQIYMVPVDELWVHRIQTKTRKNSRPGGVRMEYDSRKKKSFKRQFPGEYYSGTVKWDLLYEDMKKNGWSCENPAVFKIRTNRKSRLWDGHHRLSIAKELGLEEVPVRFIYGK